MSHALHDPEPDLSASCEPEAAEEGEDRLVLTTAGTEEILEFAMLPADAVGGVRSS